MKAIFTKSIKIVNIFNEFMTRNLFQIISDVFQVEQEKISDSTTQNDIEGWDSLNALLLIEEIEKEYEIKLPIDDVIEISSVNDIKRILKNHGIEEF